MFGAVRAPLSRRAACQGRLCCVLVAVEPQACENKGVVVGKGGQLPQKARDYRLILVVGYTPSGAPNSPHIGTQKVNGEHRSKPVRKRQMASAIAPSHSQVHVVAFADSTLDEEPLLSNLHNINQPPQRSSAKQHCQASS